MEVVNPGFDIYDDPVLFGGFSGRATGHSLLFPKILPPTLHEIWVIIAPSSYLPANISERRKR